MGRRSLKEQSANASTRGVVINNISDVNEVFIKLINKSKLGKQASI
jgi:hypothetical protein